MERECAADENGVCSRSVDRRGVPSENRHHDELTSYEANKVELADELSVWQRLVAQNFGFDLERYFPEEMMHLDLRTPDPQWQILTADDLRREAQKGHQSLKEKYGK